MVLKPITEEMKMSRGMRDNRRTPLTDEEIEFIKSEIDRIQADPSVFVFNDPEHIQTGTCYHFKKDVIYVSRNVLPDTDSGSIHPRDILSVAGVLAHEYYGHRPYRAEYLKEETTHNSIISDVEDEIRASITAAKTTPNLEQKERSYLILDAIARADENGLVLEMDNYMKEVVYGRHEHEKNFITDPGIIRLSKSQSKNGLSDDGLHIGKVSDLRRNSEIAL